VADEIAPVKVNQKNPSEAGSTADHQLS